MNNIELVIFDCDGVLIDSEVLSLQVWIEMLAARGIQIDSAYFARHFLGRSMEHVKAKVLDDFGLEITHQLAEEFADRLQKIFAEKLTVTPHIEALLQSLTVPYVLATSSSPARTRMALSVSGLDRYFTEQQIFTASMVEHGKPAPDLFLHAASNYQTSSSSCLVLEDSAPGLAAAKAAGMQFRHYIGGSHLSHMEQSDQDTLADWRDFAVQFPEILK